MMTADILFYSLIAFIVILIIGIKFVYGESVRRWYEITRRLNSEGTEVYTVTCVCITSVLLWKLKLYSYKSYSYFQEQNVGYFKFTEYPTIRDAGVAILEDIRLNKIKDARNKYKNEVVLTIETEADCAEIIN